MRRLVVLAALFAAALLVAAGGLVLYGIDRFQREGPLKADAIVYIPPGEGLEAIAARLEEAGVIDDALAFQIGVTVMRATRALKAGEYRFAAGISMRGALDVLRSGKTVVRKLTLPEGLTSAEIAALVVQAEGLDGGIGATPPEGSLLPETYHYERGDTRAALIERMTRAQEVALAELWPNRVAGLPLARPEDAVILASIVEKETGVPEERPLVASVFINRMAKGMRLQSDPTVVYGLTNGKGPLGRELTRKDLQTPSPYNTYLNDGLPPGPIANPGRASIAAVLNPAKTEYLYFVADGNGGHRFAKTLDEHNRNVSRYRKNKTQNQQE